MSRYSFVIQNRIANYDMPTKQKQRSATAVMNAEARRLNFVRHVNFLIDRWVARGKVKAEICRIISMSAKNLERWQSEGISSDRSGKADRFARLMGVSSESLWQVNLEERPRNDQLQSVLASIERKFQAFISSNPDLRKAEQLDGALDAALARS